MLQCLQVCPIPSVCAAHIANTHGPLLEGTPCAPASASTDPEYKRPAVAAAAAVAAGRLWQYTAVLPCVCVLNLFCAPDPATCVSVLFLPKSSQEGSKQQGVGVALGVLSVSFWGGAAHAQR